MKYVLLSLFCLINLVLMATSSVDIQTLKTQARQGNADAQWELGICYHDGIIVAKNLPEAVKWYRKAAAQGNVKAQVLLGACYCEGEGVTKNYPEAVKWYRKAAEQGLAEAQMLLGICYYDGVGVTKNYPEAVKWLRKAAEQGLAEAQRLLGVCYTKGEGVAQNAPEAIKWLRKAAEQGDAYAKQVLVEFLKNLLIYEARAVYQKRIKAVKQNDFYSYLSTYASYLRKNRSNAISKEFENLVQVTRSGLQINVKDIQLEGVDDEIYHFRVVVQVNHIESSALVSFIYEEDQLVIVSLLVRN